MKIKILITSIGGMFSHDLVRALRRDKRVYILGTDMRFTSNSYFLDKFEILPNPKKNGKKYILKLIKLCKKFKINFILPCSENECFEISKYIKILDKLKIKTSVSDFEITKNLVDKHILFKILKENKIDVGEWFPLNNFKELTEASKKLGYPKKKLIIKPRKGSGSKGVIILDNNVKSFKYLLSDQKRFCGTCSIKALGRELKKNNKNLNGYFVMPFYNNKTFDVDCLAKNGSMKLCISRLRTYKNPLSPTNEGCKIMEHSKISNYCRKIIRILNINGVCDFDIILKKDSRPQIIDASCRLSGSSTASLSIGLNIPIILLRLLSNERVNVKKLKKIYHVFPQNRFELIKK